MIMPGKRADAVLVVDDEEDIRLLLHVFLTRLGFHVDTAESATAALALLQDRRFDFILTDIRMPRMSGYQFIEEASRVTGGKARFVTMSGNMEIDPARPGLRVSAHLAKPFDFEGLQAFFDKLRGASAASYSHC